MNIRKVVYRPARQESDSQSYAAPDCDAATSRKLLALDEFGAKQATELFEGCVVHPVDTRKQPQQGEIVGLLGVSECM